MKNLNSQEQLTDYLIEKGILKTDRIIKAFYEVDRKNFVTEKNKKIPYIDTALGIGYSATISQPTVVALMLEWLQPEVGEKIMEIGSGSGRVSSMLAHIVGEKGYVYGIEIVPELVEISKQNSSGYNLQNLEFMTADKNQLGLKEKAPFQKILVSASGKELPKTLLYQLTNPGKLVIPIKNEIQVVKKDFNDNIEIDQHFGFSFVPLQ